MHLENRFLEMEKLLFSEMLEKKAKTVNRKAVDEPKDLEWSENELLAVEKASLCLLEPSNWVLVWAKPKVSEPEKKLKM